MVSVTNKFGRTYNAANPNVAKVNGIRLSGGASLSCDNLAGWPTTTHVYFSTYKIDTSLKVIPGTQIDWKGIVSSNTIGTMTRVTGATDNGNTVGDIVEMNPTASWADDLVQGIQVSHNDDGTMKTALPLASPVLTTPKVVTSINDTSGNELISVTSTASAVNQINVTNSAAGTGPTLSAIGGDTNINLTLTGKGTGGVLPSIPYKFRVFCAAGFTVPAGGGFIVPHDTKQFDTGTNVDIVTHKGRFTAPIAGFYHFDATVAATLSSGNVGWASLYKNGVEVSRGVEMDISTTFANNVSISDTLQLAANDYIEIWYQGTTGSGAGVDANGIYNHFSGFLESI